jgi:hypothetical protein
MSDQTQWVQSPLVISQAMMRYQSSRSSVLNTLERQAAEKKAKSNTIRPDEGVIITLSAAAQAKMAEAPT